MEKVQGHEWEATLRTHLDLVCVRVQEVSKCFYSILRGCWSFLGVCATVRSKVSISSHY